MARSSITGGILCRPNVQSRIDMSTKTLDRPLRHIIIMPKITCQVLFTRSQSKRMSTSCYSYYDVKCCFRERLICISNFFNRIAMQSGVPSSGLKMHSSTYTCELTLSYMSTGICL